MKYRQSPVLNLEALKMWIAVTPLVESVMGRMIDDRWVALVCRSEICHP